MSLDHEHDRAYEYDPGAQDARVFLTCEHASERLPAPWSWPEPDVRLLGTHWAYDLGAAELTRELAHALRAPAVLSCFSRLLADPNRPEDSPELFRQSADGLPIELNRQVTDADRDARLGSYHRPYHAAVDQGVAASRADIVLAIHSFTPVYEGRARPMEVGVLFHHEHDLAEHTAAILRNAGMLVALNEPYSGRDGLIYAAERHADAHGRRALELEVRQDRATQPGFRERLIEALVPLFGA